MRSGRVRWRMIKQVRQSGVAQMGIPCIAALALFLSRTCPFSVSPACHRFPKKAGRL